MTGVLLVAHGSLLNPDSSQPARKLVALLRDLERFDEVRVAFWKEQPSYREALLTMSSDDIVIVPLFISHGHFSQTVVPRELGLAGGVTKRAGRTLRYAEPVGTHTAMTHVILRRAQEALKRGRIPRKASALVIVGHGTERNKRSSEAIYTQVERLERTSGFGEVKALFLDESPRIADLYTEVEAKQIVVVPYFISDGQHTREDIPAAIGLGSAALAHGTVALGLHDGRRVLYTSAVGTDATLVEVAVARIEEALAISETPVSGEPEPWLDSLTPAMLERARGRFLEALDRAGELHLGELIVENQGAEGFFRLLHVKDQGLAGLRSLKSLDELDALCHGSDSRYRPLRYRADLERGWKLKAHDANTLFDALEVLYPGGVALRYGQLQPVLWSDSSERHTGQLAALEELDQDAARRAAHAACGGLGCLRQPRWLDEPIDTGSEAFACLETCALMNAFALRIQREEELAPVAGGEAVAMLSEQARATVETALRAMRRDATTLVAAFDDPTNPAWITYLLARHYGWKD